MTPDSGIPEKVKEIVKSRFRSMKVLLVDDMELNITNNMMTLCRIGFSRSNISSANNGLMAFQMATKASPDLIMTDWNMPMTDGLTFVKKFRNFPAYKNIPIIMITAEPDKNRAEVEMYINGFLKKPYTVTDVENLIYSVVGRKILADR
jgi:two-component system, chemotaxis family, chemotaxis protein CheY